MRREHYALAWRGAAIAAGVAIAAPSAGAPMSCEELAGLSLPDTTITLAATVPAGTFDPPGGTPPIAVSACRGTGSIAPTAD